MEDKKSDPPKTTWTEYIRGKPEASVPESSTETQETLTAENAENKEIKTPTSQETGKSKTWGITIPVLTPSSWKKTSEKSPKENATQDKQEEKPKEQEEKQEEKPKEEEEKPNEDTVKPAKTWGDMIHPALNPTTWRKGKSRDEGDTSQVTEEVLKEEPMSKTEPCEDKSKEKCETSSTQVPAKTWGEMIHPAMYWRRKSRDDVAGPSEPGVQVGDDELSETSDDVPRAAEGTLAAVATSIKRSIAGMTRWSMADLTLGLYKLSGRHALEGVADTINGSRVTSLEELQEIEHWFNWAFAAYKKNKQKLADGLKIEESQIVKHVFTSGVLKPAYFIAIDNTRKCVVMCIRGTLAATDVLTDLNPHSEKFEGGYAHSGMLAAAGWLMENEATTIRDLLTSNPEYKFVIVGHSLGAGTAALLCMLLRDYDGGRVGPLSKIGIPPSWITCWGYGCPPCVDKRLAEETGFIKNIVLQDDVVARISPGALEDLRTEILETDWSQAFKDGSKGKKMLELAQSTLNTLPDVARKYGHAALVVARSGAMAGTKLHKAANWFTVGIAAAELLRSAAAYRASTNENNVEDEVEKKASEGTEVAAATLAANVAESVKDPKESLEEERLYVPGILYHILRKPLQPDVVWDSVFPAQEQALITTEEESTEEDKKKSSKSKAKSKQPTVQHIVVRGDDPSSRFKRIVLSSTLLSDHGCLQYKESIQDAISWIQRET